MKNKLLIDIGSTYFKVSTDSKIEQHFRDFNKDIFDDLTHKCGETINSFKKEPVEKYSEDVIRKFFAEQCKNIMF